MLVSHLLCTIHCHLLGCLRDNTQAAEGTGTGKKGAGFRMKDVSEARLRKGARGSTRLNPYRSISSVLCGGTRRDRVTPCNKKARYCNTQNEGGEVGNKRREEKRKRREEEQVLRIRGVCVIVYIRLPQPKPNQTPYVLA